MKKWSFAVVLLMTAIFFTACSNSAPEIILSNDARHLDRDWQTETLARAQPIGQPPEHIEMRYISSTQGCLTFQLINHSDEIWHYHAPFRLDVLLGSRWYSIHKVTEWLFHHFEYSLRPRRDKTVTVSFSGWLGIMPPGTYRFVRQDMYIIFEITPDTLMRCATFIDMVALYMYDGEKTEVMSVFGAANVRPVIEALNSIDAQRVTHWTHDYLTMPIFGLSARRTCQYAIYALWSNGYWITDRGTVYRVDIDFDYLMASHSWGMRHGEPRVINGFALPLQDFLNRDANGWRREFLPLARPLEPMEGIEVALASHADREITLSVTNRNDHSVSLIEIVRIHVLLDNNWYYVPTITGGMVFMGGLPSIRITNHATISSNYAIWYGNLFGGTYRFVFYGHYIIFEV